MNAADTLTATEPRPVPGRNRTRPGCGADASRPLVLAQSWVPASASCLPRAELRRSALRAARAFTLLSRELSLRPRDVNPTTA